MKKPRIFCIPSNMIKLREMWQDHSAATLAEYFKCNESTIFYHLRKLKKEQQEHKF